MRARTCPAVWLLTFAVAFCLPMSAPIQAQEVQMAPADEPLVFLAVWLSETERIAGITAPGEAFTVALGEDGLTLAFRPTLNPNEDGPEVMVYQVEGAADQKSETFLTQITSTPGEISEISILGLNLKLEAMAFGQSKMELVKRCCVSCGTTTACGRCVFHDCGNCCEPPKV